MDLRQFLLDAPETCFYTCYDLILKASDGVRYHLAEYLEIGEVADVSAGGCSLEMMNGIVINLLSSLNFESKGSFLSFSPVLVSYVINEGIEKLTVSFKFSTFYSKSSHKSSFSY